MDAAERFRSYRRYVYEVEDIKRADGSSSVTVDEKILEKESKTDFEISRHVGSDTARATFRTLELLEPKSLCQQIISDLSTSSSQNTKKNQSL